MKTILLTMMVFCSSTMFADSNIKRPDSYNYTRGVEAIQNNKAEEALEYLNKEIAEHPDNGYAYSWLALVKNYNEDFGEALTASNVAIKKIPSKDKEYKSFAYSTRAKVFLNLQDTVQAYKDYAAAISLTPQNDKLYNARAQVYYEQEKYDLSDQDYRKMISLKEGDVMGYMGIGRNANAQKKYEDAIKQFDYVIKLAPTYSSGYSFRADSYIGLKKYREAIDDVITALGIDNNSKAFYELQQLADSASGQMIAKLKVQKVKEPNENSWIYYLGVAYERANNYKQAISNYKESLAKEQNAVVADRISDCYNKIGLYEEALEYCNQAIALDSTDTDYLLNKAIIEDFAGKYKDAISDMTNYIAHEPENSFGYYRRGWIKDKMKDYDGAIEDYTMAITLNPDDAYSYMCRGNIYQLKGETEKSKRDFEEAIRLDSIPEQADCSFYAYYYLGEKDKAISVMDALLKKGEKGNYYDAACLYSIMEEKDKAILFLSKALENGYRNFAHMERDRDLDNIRNMQAYKDLVNKYKKIQQGLEDEEQLVGKGQYEEKKEEIPFTKDGGVYKVKCAINNLPLHFIFDTGASDVSISSVEATFMVKNDYLSSNDILGKQSYLNANGEISEGTVINLRDVKLGNLHLNNVKASVVKNQSAPLLLGQTVLSRLGKIEIDNNKSVLKITYKKKIQ